MAVTFQMLLIVCPLVFLAATVDAIGGGGGLISLPAYLLAGLPPALAGGSNKLSAGFGTLVATFKFLRGGKILLKPGLCAVLGALPGSYLGAQLLQMMDEQVIRIFLLVAIPLPGTGAWTGTFAASILHMEFKKSVIAVVLGVCGGTAAMQAAAADICIMSEEGELFLTAPFTSAAAGDAVEGAGSAAMAAKAGVAALVEKDAEAAVAKAAEIVGMLPSNNLTSPALFEFAEPAAWPAKYEAAAAAAALADGESLVELNAGYGKNVYTALGTVNGAVVGFVATQPQGL